MQVEAMHDNAIAGDGTSDTIAMCADSVVCKFMQRMTPLGTSKEEDNTVLDAIAMYTDIADNVKLHDMPFPVSEDNVLGGTSVTCADNTMQVGFIR